MTNDNTQHRNRTTAWWAFALISLFYGMFGLTSAASELLFLLGMAPEAKHRAAPLVFTLHALTGGIVFLAAPLQFHRAIRRRVPLHRAIGKTYVVGVCLASLLAIVDARSFQVSAPARLIFVVTALAWLGATLIAFLRARAKQFREHADWMIRSASLTFFAVTFSLWVPVIASTALPRELGYPFALLLSGGLNLLVAELWIRRTRARAGAVVLSPLRST